MGKTLNGLKAYLLGPNHITHFVVAVVLNYFAAWKFESPYPVGVNLFQNQQWNCQNNVQNLLKVKSRDTRTVAITCFVASFSLVYISCLLLQKVVLFENPYRYDVTDFNPLSANPAKWSDTLKQFFGFCRQIV